MGVAKTKTKSTPKECSGCNVAKALEKKHDADVLKFKDDIKCEVAKEVGEVVDKRLQSIEKILLDDHEKMKAIYPRIEKDIKFGKALDYIFQYVREMKASVWVKGLIILGLVIIGIVAGLKFAVQWFAQLKLFGL